MRNYDKQAILKADTEHHFHPFTHHKSLWGDKSLWAVGEAAGCHLTDLDGRKILDFMAGLWCVNVGYGRKEIADAVYEQISELHYYNTFFKSTHPAVAELSEKLAGLLGGGLPYIFYGSSGSESNDTIVRAVRMYWQNQGKEKKRAIISRENAYHGSTLAGANLGGMPLMHKQAGLEVADIYHIQQPYSYKYARDEKDLDSFGVQVADKLEEEILRLGADNVAAFIGEPIQGAGGVIIPPASYWPRIAEICKRHDILLVADEVICGFGRTGDWFGHKRFGFQPDLVTMAKGLTSGYIPLSAVAMSGRVAEVLSDCDGEEFTHGYTYSGHPVACAAALANIAILESEGLVDYAGGDGERLLSEALAKIATHELVGEVRHCGLIGAVELVGEGLGVVCRDYCLDEGVILRACGDTMVMSPPLCVGAGEIDEMVEKFMRALDKTAQHATSHP